MLEISMMVMWEIIKSLWFLWVIALGIAAVPVLFNILVRKLVRKIEEIRLKRWLEKHKKLEDWKKLDGREFEKVVAVIYEKLGYKTKITGGPKDRGIDIIANREGKRTFIQCKQMEVVQPKYIREFYGSIVDHLKEGENGLLITTGVFTEEGYDYDFVKDKRIELIDGLKLEKLANQF